MKIFAYLSKNPEYEQDKTTLAAAVKNHSFKIHRMIEEGEDGHEGFAHLMKIAQPGDILLVPRFRILLQLPKEEWRTLHNTTETGLIVVALNFTSTMRGLFVTNAAERLASKASTDTLMEAAEKILDYIQINPAFAKRKSPTGSAAGRPVDKDLHHQIFVMLLTGASYSDIQKTLNCGRSTIARVKQSMNEFSKSN